MAQISQHIQQWKHNRAFLSQIPPDYSDWMVTVSFYVALHAVDAMLTSHKVRGVTRHDARNEVLLRTNKYSQVWKHYQPLYDLSRTVRYLANPGHWVPFEQIESQVFKRLLYPLEQAVQRQIKQDLALDAIILADSQG